MACWLDEVDAGVHTIVNDVHSVDLVLCIEVCIEALFNVLHDWLPRIIVIDEVSKAGRVHNS